MTLLQTTAVSVGSVPCLGVVGYVMFGGVGMLGRSLGCMVDHVAVEEMVADVRQLGAVHQVSEPAAVIELFDRLKRLLCPCSPAVARSGRSIGVDCAIVPLYRYVPILQHAALRSK